MIQSDKLIDFADNSTDDICFINADYFYYNTFKWRGKSHPDPAKLKANIITGDSDYPITDDIVKKYPQFKTWFVANNHSTLSYVWSVPLGLTNNRDQSEFHPIFGNTKVFFEINNKPKEIKNLAYMNVRIETHKQERQLVFDKFSPNSWVTTEKPNQTMEGRKTFLEQVYNHRFCICPRGNGLDTHRLWESLYLRTIPIVLWHSHFEHFKDLPILFINSWDEVTEDFLNKKYDEIMSKNWNFDKLRVSYWKKFILDTISKS